MTFFVRGLLSDQNENIFTKRLKTHLHELFARNLSINDSAVPEDYILHHMVSDFAETISWWTKNNQYTPEEICSFYLSTTPYLNTGEN